MKRRGRGEGSVFKRKDGTWTGIITTGYTETGKRRRRHIYAKSKGEVLEQLTRLKHAALTNTLGDPGRLTVAEFLTKWLQDSARPAIRAYTFNLYEMVIRRHVIPHLGGVRLARLGPAHIQNLLATLERDGIGAPTRQVIFRVLHRSLKQAVSWNLLATNPASPVTRPRVARREMQTLGADQARTFLDTVKGDRLEALYVLLITTGLRIGEALGVSWPDLDLTRGTLTIRRQLCEASGRLWLAEPKTTAGRRTVDLPAVTMEALREHEARARAEGTLLNDQLLIFADSEGNPIRRTNLRRRSFARLLRKAGLPSMRIHDLRHSAATLHLAAGTNPRVVQQLLGHSDVRLTLSTYSHVLPSMSKEAASRMDTLLGREVN